MNKEMRLAAALVVFAWAAACSTPSEGEVVVSVNGSVSSLVTTAPEQSTTTAPENLTTTTQPGTDPQGCVAPGQLLTIALATGVQAQTPCPVSTSGRLRFANLTGSEVNLQWGTRTLSIPAQQSVSPPETVGEVLSPGLHAFDTSLPEAPTVVVQAPEAGFGAAVVGLRSFGGVRPGQRVSEAEAALGVSIVVPQRESECTVGWIAGDAHSPLLALDSTDVDPVIQRADATSPSQLTISEVGLGSTVPELEAAYGDQLTNDGATYTFEPNEAVDANYRLVFSVAGQTEPVVTSVRIGRVGKVASDTPC